MAEKKPRGEFEIFENEWGCKEMVFTAFTMLESRGYPGFTELMTIINDPTILLKIIRFLYGTNIKVPPLDEFVKCLRAAMYAFCDMHKRCNAVLPVQPKNIRDFLDISSEEEKELLDIFDSWSKYMSDNGKPVYNVMHVNRNNTVKRMKMAAKGKKWTAKKY